MKNSRSTILGLTLAISANLSAGTLFFGAYPNSLLVFDEAQGRVVDRIMLQTGLPTSIRLSPDKTKIYVTTNDHAGLEVVDVASRKVIRHLTLNSGPRRYRFNGGVADPSGKLFYTITTEITKQLDRFEISKPRYTVIDLEQGKIVKAIEVAKEDENAIAGGGGGRNGGFDISPDGKYLYQFRDSVVILNSDDFKVVDRIELAKPEFPGMEAIGFGGLLDSIDEAGERVSVFNSSDPVVHNRLFGIAKFDLVSRKMDYSPIGPSPAAMSGLQVAPDKNSAYVVVSSGQHGNKRCEFWSFDLKSKSISGTQEFQCRSRFSFGMSADGKKLYIYGAGFEFDVYDAATLKFEKTWDTNNDITGAGLVVVP
jgi:DNA-binding beta-propeller fold protein YncE